MALAGRPRWRVRHQLLYRLVEVPYGTIAGPTVKIPRCRVVMSSLVVLGLPCPLWGSVSEFQLPGASRCSKSKDSPTGLTSRSRTQRELIGGRGRITMVLGGSGSESTSKGTEIVMGTETGTETGTTTAVVTTTSSRQHPSAGVAGTGESTWSSPPQTGLQETGEEREGGEATIRYGLRARHS